MNIEQSISRQIGNNRITAGRATNIRATNSRGTMMKSFLAGISTKMNFDHLSIMLEPAVKD